MKEREKKEWELFNSDLLLTPYSYMSLLFCPGNFQVFSNFFRPFVLLASEEQRGLGTYPKDKCRRNEENI